MPGIYITNDKSEIKKIIDDEFKLAAGQIEYQHFMNAENIIFCEADEETFKGVDSEQALYVWLSWVQMLLNDLWLVVDNSVICEVAFCKMLSSKETAWTRNNLTYATYTSSGEQFVNTAMTVSDLESWAQTSFSMQSYLHNSNSTLFNSFTNMKFTRIGRAMRFVRAAIREQHPAVKLSHYCTAFESIFSTDNSGLSHKLSERVAIFLRGYEYDPIEVFDNFKEFYNIRSSVTHGSSLKLSKENQLSSLSCLCDQYLRTIIKIITQDSELRELFDGGEKELDKFFKYQLLKVG